MNILKKYFSILTVIGVILILLHNQAFSNDIIKYKVPEKDIVVKDNKIYHQDKPFAELRFFNPFQKTGSYKGLVMYYYDYDEEVWISPREGWSYRLNNHDFKTIKELNDIHDQYKDKQIDPSKGPKLLIGGKRPSKDQIIESRCYNVNISEDGKYVYYKTQGKLFDTSHTYYVEYGLSK